MNRRSFLKSWLAGALAAVGLPVARNAPQSGYYYRIDGGQWHYVSPQGAGGSAARLTELTVTNHSTAMTWTGTLSDGTNTEIASQGLNWVFVGDWGSELLKIEPDAFILSYDTRVPR